MNQDKKKIFIAGGGFAGLVCAKDLSKQLGASAEIFVIDREPYQIYHPYLYETATTEEEFVSMDQVKRSITIPFAELLPAGVRFLQGSVTSIDRNKKTIQVAATAVGTEKLAAQNPADKSFDSQEYNFDILVLALGSKTDFFNVQGLEEHALTLKSLPDSFRIRDACETIIEELRQDIKKKQVRFLIGGGGFTGVELAGEFVNFVNILSWKYNFPREKIEVMVVEFASQLLPGLDKKISQKALRRLRESGVAVRLETGITSVEKDFVQVSTGETIAYDLLVWTGGVRAVRAPFAQAVAMDPKDRIMVNEFRAIPPLQKITADAENQQASSSSPTQKKTPYDIFVIGDCAGAISQTARPAPQTATNAIYQGSYVARQISRMLWGKSLEPFEQKEFPYIISVRGKWAILHAPSGFAFSGFLAWIIHIGSNARYLARFMPWSSAISHAWYSARIFMRND